MRMLFALLGVVLLTHGAFANEAKNRCADLGKLSAYDMGEAMGFGGFELTPEMLSNMFGNDPASVQCALQGWFAGGMSAAAIQGHIRGNENAAREFGCILNGC